MHPTLSPQAAATAPAVSIVAINRPREAKISAQRPALILRAKQSTAAQLRQHQFDEIRQAARQDRGHDVVAVCPILDEAFFQLIRDLLGRSDHLPMSASARYAQIKLANRQVFAPCQFKREQLTALARVSFRQLGNRTIERVSRQVEPPVRPETSARP